MDYFNLLKEYKKNAPILNESNWFDLPKGTNVLLKNFPKEIQKMGRLITIKRLLSYFGKDKSLNGKIIGIKPSQNKEIFSIRFPINLRTKEYVQLYALMISEGSFRTEFSLNVPEEEFHNIFKESLKKIISDNLKIVVDENSGIKRSRASALIREILPFYKHLPALLFKDKILAREYLRVVFEAEGSPILNLNKHKKYLKLSRNSDVSDFFDKETGLIEGKRVFINAIKKYYPTIFKKIVNFPNITLLGEHLLLKDYFNIDSDIKLESIRLNRIDNRCGGISAKWVLYIYSENVNKFIEQIGFISNVKNEICNKMKQISSQRPKYFAVKIMKNIQKNKIFYAKDFMFEMKKLGYKSPQKFLWDYTANKKILRRIGKAKYKILI
jgi:hypothetical protein